ncbi:S-adenosyl-L-methionine-dependent methyltransferase [Thozetella sp. PMI_491]|nr:S-adenosyl-L-methionine-dependent methyltransferase [Thozetella sp. PMI_491]
MSSSHASNSLTGFEFSFEVRVDSDPDSSAEAFDTQSLTESITTFHEEFGRTYHAFHAGSYPYPNDAWEKERLEHQHQVVKTLLGGRSFVSPFTRDRPPRRVLDIGTGTGAWVIDVADEFPGAELVRGIDLSPIQSEYVPPNVEFHIEDANDGWDEGLNIRYDLIHTRMTMGCWRDMQTDIVQRSFDRLEPGGYLECHEVLVYPFCDDGTMPTNFPFRRWALEANEASAALDRQFFVGHELKRWFIEAGFVDVHERAIKVPINPWPADRRSREIGEGWQGNLERGISGWSMGLFNRVWNIEPEHIEIGLVDVRQAIANTSVHAYQVMFVVWGRKPGSPQQHSSPLRPRSGGSSKGGRK